MGRSKRNIIFLAFFGAIVIGTGFFGYHDTWHLPGHLSKAHAVFESACTTCHEPWSDSFTAKCMTCHERTLIGDSHGAKAMAHPAKAHVPAKLADLDCADCHGEHTKEEAGFFAEGNRLCLECHKMENINEEHIILQNYSCVSKACHSYHFNFYRDNNTKKKMVRLLPESKHPPKRPKPNIKKIAKENILAMQGGKFYTSHPIIATRYAISPHFGTEATCLRCHENERGAIDLSPPADKCVDCHEAQTRTFSHGRHGTPYALGVTPSGGSYKEITCGTCHNVHSLRLEKSRSQACLVCHDGAHAVNSLGSMHSIYLTDPMFKFNPLTGADCATCHMPKLAELDGATDHNESWVSTTTHRMLSKVCSRCHGITFALKSLAGGDTIDSGFTYSPEMNGKTQMPNFKMDEK